MVQKLNSLCDDPKEFWNMINKLQKDHNTEVNDPACNISKREWMQHFQNLMFKTHVELSSPLFETVKLFVNNDENWQIFNELNYKISNEEVARAIKGLKTGKACAVDMISNEMLRTGIEVLTLTLAHIFNAIMLVGECPSIWRKSWLKPLHKGGNYMDPNRYRGIALMSCMGKFFCAVLNNHLVKFMKDNNKSSIFQIGFSEHRKTSDHMLTLETLIDKYTQKGQKLYACFIDFKKAFDSVCTNCSKIILAVTAPK